MLEILLATIFYVSPDAASGGNGSKARPFRDPNAAIEAARKSASDKNEIVFNEGVHALKETIRLDSRDDGLILRAAKAFSATLSGAVRITGWQIEKGTKYWYADIPEAENNQWYFKSLIVNGKSAKRAVFPGSGEWLQNTRQWKVAWLSGVGGGWERKPTVEELTTMPVKKGDLPLDLDCESAEFQVLHSWNDSLVRVKSFDKINSLVTFQTPTAHPAGSFGQHEYAVYNIPQGMTESGEWYLDAKRGRIHYWPKEGEKIESCEFCIPKIEKLIEINEASGISISGLILENSSQPKASPGFGGANLPGLISASKIDGCRFRKLMFRYSGGIGLSIKSSKDCEVSGCGFKENGSCAIDVNGKNIKVCDNRVKNVGIKYRSASAFSIHGNDNLVSGNDISGAPYCGVNFSGQGHVFENNRVGRVMLVLNDGGAFYGGADSRDCIIRGNHAFDIGATRKGAGCHAYYFDEGCIDGQIVSNTTDGVAIPVLNHMARRIAVRNNTFCLNNGEIKVQFSRCSNCELTDNEFRAMGDVKIADLSSITKWSGNRKYKYSPVDSKPVGNFKPINLGQREKLSPRTDALPVERALGAISVGAKFDDAVWPGTWNDDFRRTTDMMGINGQPIWIRAARDGANLFLCVRLAQFSYDEIAVGHDDEKSDWVSFEFRNQRYRIYSDGTSNAKTSYAGYEEGKSKGFGKRVQYMVKIPFSELGYEVAPKEGMEIAFNCQVHNATYNEIRCWEGLVKGNAAAGRLVIK